MGWKVEFSFVIENVIAQSCRGSGDKFCKGNKMRNSIAGLVSASLIAFGVAGAANAGPEKAAKMEKMENHEIGLKVGDTIPTGEAAAKVVTGVDGATSTLEALKGTNGATFVFVRSADWCPFCKKQMKDMENVAAQLDELGYPLVAISYDAPETLAAFKEKQNLSYQLVSDTASANIKAFGLLNTKYEEGSKAYGIPHPAVLVVGSDNTVAVKLMEEGYKERPASEVVLSAVQSIQK